MQTEFDVAVVSVVVRVTVLCPKPVVSTTPIIEAPPRIAATVMNTYLLFRNVIGLEAEWVMMNWELSLRTA